MKKALIESGNGLTKIELKYLEQKFTNKTKEEIGYLDKKLEAEKTAKSFLGKMFGGTADGQSISEIEHSIDKSAADDLFEEIKKQFSDAVQNANGLLNENSKVYWQQKVKELKEKLTSIIVENASLADEKKGELSSIIASYQDIPFEDLSEEVFLREDFEKYLFSFRNVKIGETFKLNLSKLGMTYNRKLQDYVDSTYTTISESHKASFSKWSSELLESISLHVQELNPTLRALVEEIRVDSEKISDLENRQARLAGFTSQIENLMAWKER